MFLRNIAALFGRKGSTVKGGMPVPESILRYVDARADRLRTRPNLMKLYRNCALSTWETALKQCDDGTVFVLTGDIPAMWLRDSSAQVGHYISMLADADGGASGQDINAEASKQTGTDAPDAQIRSVIEGVIRRQFKYIDIDPYANAFNMDANGHGHISDIPKPGPWVWERKYEIDSLCYPIRLLYLYWKKTGNLGFVREILPWAAATILSVFRTEQHHMEKSEYRFTRPNPGKPWSTIYNDGMGAPVTFTGMIWSGFRPSDDGCEYGYLIASNMFASVALGYMIEMLEALADDKDRDCQMSGQGQERIGMLAIADECCRLRSDIDEGIARYGIVDHPKYGRIYCCETDGMGHYNMLDDANVPSLLSAPYIGYLAPDDPVYQNTRRFLLSSDNPYYFEGKYAKGIGSRHTPDGFIWHMGLVMQGLTATDPDEKRAVLDMLEATDAGTGHLHESFDANDPASYTREWFTWPEALFAEFIANCTDCGLL